MTARVPDLRHIGEIVRFWRDAGPARWFQKDGAFDFRFRERFMRWHMAAARRELDHWATDAEGAFALLILLDQFPRNAFRGTAHMFATDPLARHFASGMIGAGLDRQIEPSLRLFCYLPFEHSELLIDQERSLFLHAGLDPSLGKWAQEHHRIIVRFGRFPHRNMLLGRETTAEEQDFLDKGGFAG
ncbi:DUF924 family protein [Candidimonas sp. SYP-B2681]|uniref:DUF924 family protein n=1 Tax=Candidimonas sp. SYP-B2681 TaxID=2497686 RepID=UPI000F892068|nr:DUF924 family protein [Candidimonas sp. SYP-B2681]RTZ47856.1 DUF924 family protein [Candidimonas sp. SYP-B2681]